MSPSRSASRPAPRALSLLAATAASLWLGACELPHRIPDHAPVVAPAPVTPAATKPVDRKPATVASKGQAKPAKPAAAPATASAAVPKKAVARGPDASADKSTAGPAKPAAVVGEKTKIADPAPAPPVAAGSSPTAPSREETKIVFVAPDPKPVYRETGALAAAQPPTAKADAEKPAAPSITEPTPAPANAIAPGTTVKTQQTVAALEKEPAAPKTAIRLVDDEKSTPAVPAVSSTAPVVAPPASAATNPAASERVVLVEPSPQPEPPQPAVTAKPETAKAEKPHAAPKTPSRVIGVEHSEPAKPDTPLPANVIAPPPAEIETANTAGGERIVLVEPPPVSVSPQPVVTAQADTLKKATRSPETTAVEEKPRKAATKTPPVVAAAPVEVASAPRTEAETLPTLRRPERVEPEVAVPPVATAATPPAATPSTVAPTTKSIPDPTAGNIATIASSAAPSEAPTLALNDPRSAAGMPLPNLPVLRSERATAAEDDAVAMTGPATVTAPTPSAAPAAVAQSVTQTRFDSLSRRTGLSDAQLATLAEARADLAAGRDSAAEPKLRALERELDRDVREIVTAPGDTLPLIAALDSTYGNAELWPLIWHANPTRVKDPARLGAGIRLRVPLHPTIEDITAALDDAHRIPLSAAADAAVAPAR